MYLLCCLIIGLVSVYDIYMTIIYPMDVYMLEQNPVAMYIIKNWGISSFVTIKSFTTIFIVIILVYIRKTKYKNVVIVLTLCQLILFLYLNFYTPTEYGGKPGHEPHPGRHLIEFIEDPDRFWSENPSGQEFF